MRKKIVELLFFFPSFSQCFAFLAHSPVSFAQTCLRSSRSPTQSAGMLFCQDQSISDSSFGVRLSIIYKCLSLGVYVCMCAHTYKHVCVCGCGCLLICLLVFLFCLFDEEKGGKLEEDSLNCLFAWATFQDLNCSLPMPQSLPAPNGKEKKSQKIPPPLPTPPAKV